MGQPPILNPRFKLPMSKDDVANLLSLAITSEVAMRHRMFCDSDDLEQQIDKVSTWLTSEVGSTFGLLLGGGCGNGKTTFIRAIQRLFAHLKMKDDYGKTLNLDIKNARDLVGICVENPVRWSEICRSPMLAIDDLGCEPANFEKYHNVYTPISDLILVRHERQLFTVASTNLIPAKFAEKYDERIANRMQEMFYKVGFGNPSYRNTF